MGQLDMDRGQLTVRAGKGDKDRVTVLPSSLVEALRVQIERLRELFAQDREANLPGMWLPEDLNASQREWWNWRHEEVAERFKGSPKWPTLGRSVGATQESPQGPLARTMAEESVGLEAAAGAVPLADRFVPHMAMAPAKIVAAAQEDGVGPRNTRNTRKRWRRNPNAEKRKS